jgi:hypothetical protein
MRKIICIVFCIAFIHNVCGQETFKVTDRTNEQKLLSEIYSQWDILSSAISITRTHGVSPYEYGKYTGDLFASSWNKENGFAYDCEKIIYHWENWRTNEDAATFIINKKDESLTFKVSIHGLKNYFGEKGNFGVSFDEMMQCIKGIEEQIAEYLGYTFKMEIKEEWSPCNSTLYSFAIITITNNDPAV